MLRSFEGATGRSYDYAFLNLKSREGFPMSAGNYLFTRQHGSMLEIVYAGETESMWMFFVSTPLWEIAKKTHGATAAYVHLNPDRHARQLEHWDLVRKHHPPMNADLLGGMAS